MSAAVTDGFKGLVGQSPQIRQIRRQIEKLGTSRASVLILGESGTGKEVIARSIYHASPSGSFVPIDCGSLVGPLMESELFGHTRGAFTGASESKKGLIEQANGGTAFFDEIGDLPLELQVKLLRLLQEREYRPVGSLVRHKVDIRVVAATHRDLTIAVESGRFRQDLFYRLNVAVLRVPPLRERKEDIPLLIEKFLSRGDRRYSLTNEAMDMLLTHDWPGNVRELQNCLERLIAYNSGPLLHTGDLTTAVKYTFEGNRTNRLAAAAFQNAGTAGGGRVAMPKSSDTAAIASPPPGFDDIVRAHADSPWHDIRGTSVPTLAEVEKQAILRTLERTNGDRGVAAMMLGIGRTTLYRKLKEYRLEG